MKREFRAHQEYFSDQKLRLAKVSISTSAFRSQGDKGLIGFTQKYIHKNVDLNKFALSLKNKTFDKYLDRETEKLLLATKKFGCRWGTARKGLNILFRDVLYNSFSLRN